MSAFPSPPHRRCRTSRPDLGGRWPSRLVATAAEDRLTVRRYSTRRLRQSAIAEHSRIMSTRVARRLVPTFPVQMSPLTFARPHRFCGATARQSKPSPPIKLRRGPGWQIRCATPSASTHPSTRRRWTVRGPGPRLFSEGLFAGLWRRRLAPLDSQPAATILQTESSRRSTTTDEKYHPRPHHPSAT
jgi:hypothetical protein